ncbi:unnamed protein product [Didymodactylos carnosus]|uniref:F-box domain-containing protein n=1 Tax=Didymodactylos carnosus TaxID=1234261 RepID=A0A814U796_9BILA|nr:unnamed protein product [Didymodactylos carnosus]CAF3934617.1 unnamed protein product [Didymodactylos carnosus]
MEREWNSLVVLKATQLQQTDKSKVPNIGLSQNQEKKSDIYTARTDAYVEVNEHPLKKMIESTNLLLKDLLSKNRISKTVYGKMKPSQGCELPHLYYNPKDHKPGAPLRLIVAQIDFDHFVHTKFTPYLIVSIMMMVKLVAFAIQVWMTNPIVGFDQLPSEIILYIMDLLNPLNVIQSFFGVNKRFHKLIQYYTYSLDLRERDNDQYSTQLLIVIHSKILNLKLFPYSRERFVAASPSEVVKKKRLSYAHTNARRKLKMQRTETATRKEYLIQENDQSLDELLKLTTHEEEMIQGNSYDLTKLKEKFDLTRNKRRHLMMQTVTVEESLKLHPTLKITSLFVREINSVCDPYYESIIEAVKRNCAKVCNEEQPLTVLEFVSKHFGESKRYLLNQDIIHPYPLIQIQTAANNGKIYLLIVQNKEVIQTQFQTEIIGGFIDSYDDYKDYHISMNAFLSTSKDRRTAVSFARCSATKKDRQAIFLEIEVDIHLDETVPYADSPAVTPNSDGDTDSDGVGGGVGGDDRKIFEVGVRVGDRRIEVFGVGVGAYGEEFFRV